MFLTVRPIGVLVFFFSSRRRHTRCLSDWSSDVCSSDLRFGRTFQVRAQAEGAYRAEPEDVVRIKTRNLSGDMVPLGSVVNLRWRSGSDQIGRASCRERV